MSRAAALPAHRLPAGPQWLDAPIRPPGLLVGTEAPGVPVYVQLFRARPTSIGVFAPAQVARVLVGRLATAGTQICVVTPQPEPWSNLRGTLGQSPPWFSILPPASPLPPRGATHLPFVIVDEVDAGVPPTRREVGPWQAAVIVQPQLAPNSLGTLRSHDLLVLHRVAQAAVDPLRAGTGLPERIAKWLPRMPDDVVAVVAGSTARFVTLVRPAGGPSTPTAPAPPGLTLPARPA